jgi:hypothetical protein
LAAASRGEIAAVQSNAQAAKYAAIRRIVIPFPKIRIGSPL